ncbi:MAG: hypothetical protein D6743_08425 [Calditrichaeota bacterium]|nr:MAG: hypothetical protein D6743_08425 [Calditrichota bacterium]
MTSEPRVEDKFVEERIEVSLFESSESLKREIGERIQQRRETEWDLVRLSSRGPFIYLLFRPRTN